MAVHDHRPTDRSAARRKGSAEPVPLTIKREPSRRERRRARRAGRPKLRKLRLFIVLGGFITIAAIAFGFGVLASVASDLHGLSNQVQYQSNVDSVLYDDTGHEIGTLAPPNKAVIDRFQQISKNMDNAIVSVEDHSFWSDSGIDLKSIARAALSDITGGPKEGASTIAEEFVKNAEAEQGNRTIFEKLREAGLAFQLTHRWKPKKILDQYLNIIYFGNGAYGVEAAARTYFGQQLGFDPSDPTKGKCGTPSVSRPHMPTCASLLKPYEAALLAGMVANPTAFDPIYHPRAATGRRHLVLSDMRKYGYISRAQFNAANRRPLGVHIQQASEPASAPYFTSWVRPLIIKSMVAEGIPANRAQYEAYYGGLKIKLTLNLQMQKAAQEAVDAYFPSEKDSPTATLVSIDNANGEVRAMVSGDGDFQASPFNLATLGYRQPGSSFKLFTLVNALESGKYGPDSIIDSKQLNVPYTDSIGQREIFPVHNDDNSYLGPISLQTATDVSDNSVFVQVGMALGTKTIAATAKLMGVRTPISTNPAMIIGGLTHGVSALDMAHAYETIATGGKKVWNPVLGDYNGGPIGIQSILNCQQCNQKTITNKHPKKVQVVPASVASTVQEMLEGVVTHGTGMNAEIPGYVVAGKTGTTSSYADAWFCGWTTQLTTCVWVGYPNSARSMSTLYNGNPVVGGSFPALIWRDYMEQALAIVADQGTGNTATVTTPSDVQPVTPSTSGTGNSGNTGTAAGNTGVTGNSGTTANPGTTGGTTDNGGGTANQGGGAATTPAATPAPVQTAPATTPPAAAGGTASSNTGAGASATGGAGLGG